MRDRSNRTRDLGPEIEAILREATSKILALLRTDHEALMSAVEKRLGRREDASASPERRRLSSGRARAPEPRVSTEEVADSLRAIFASADHALRLSDLRSATGFGNMQLHRALGRLLDAGEIKKRGKVRKTEYVLVRAVAGPARRQSRRSRSERK